MVKDSLAGIDSIKWTVYGKIQAIYKHNGTVINYSYDAAGNRISKVITGATSGNGETWYVHDASGNVMSIYTVNDNTVNSGALTLTEQEIYGSSRLGMIKPSLQILPYTTPAKINMSSLGSVGYFTTFTRGQKFFELDNHLGNVLATVSDKKFGVSTSNNSVVNYYTPDIVSAQDYYPGGMTMPGRTFTANNSSYRYGFNGKEKDPKITSEDYDYGMRIYDARIVKFLSVDPLTKQYPWYSPYHFAGGNPIRNVDLDGGEPKDFMGYWQTQTLFNLKTGGKVAGTGTEIMIGTAGINYYDVEMVHDNVTKQNWFIHREGNDAYFLKNDNGDNSVMTLDAKTYELKGGHFEKFETADQQDARVASESADMLGKATFAIFAFGAAAPAASYTGGSLLALNNITRIGLTKAIVGGTTNLLAQKTVNTNGPVNWYAVGASAAFGNPWTASFAGSLSFRDNRGYHLASGTDIATGTVLGGITGSIGGKMGLSYPSATFRSVGNLSVRGSINLIPNYWSSTAGYLSSGAASNAFNPSTSSNQNSNANQTNNQEPPR